MFAQRLVYAAACPVVVMPPSISAEPPGVLARDGRAVSVEQLAPCPGSIAQCPVYGPDEPVDLVVEAAPESLPAARPGDPVVLG